MTKIIPHDITHRMGFYVYLRFQCTQQGRFRCVPLCTRTEASPVSLYDFHPTFIEVDGFENIFLGQQRWALYRELHGVLGDVGVDGELRAVGLPGEAGLIGLNVFANQVAVWIDFPFVIARAEAVVVLLKKCVRKQVVGTYQHRRADGVVFVLREIDAFIPDAEYGASRFLYVNVWVSDAV